MDVLASMNCVNNYCGYQNGNMLIVDSLNFYHSSLQISFWVLIDSVWANREISQSKARRSWCYADSHSIDTSEQT